MDRMRIYFVITICLLLSSCAGCNEDPGSTKKKTNVIETDVPEKGIDIMVHPDSPTDEMVQSIVTNLDTFMTSMSRGDFKSHLDMMYPAMFFQEGLKEDSEAQMSSWWDKGFRSICRSHKVTRISPLVELELDLVCVMWFDSEIDIVFTEAFTGEPENYGNMIRDKYGDVNYDPASRTWRANGQQKMYALTSKDTVDFKFLNESYIRSPELQNLIPYDKYMEIREFEYE